MLDEFMELVLLLLSVVVDAVVVVAVSFLLLPFLLPVSAVASVRVNNCNWKQVELSQELSTFTFFVSPSVSGKYLGSNLSIMTEHIFSLGLFVRARDFIG